MRFLGFYNQENVTRSNQQVCSTFSRSGCSVVRSVSLAKGGTSKKRPSPHLHKVSIRSNKVSPRTLQTAQVSCPFMCLVWLGKNRKSCRTDCLQLIFDPRMSKIRSCCTNHYTLMFDKRFIEWQMHSTLHTFRLLDVIDRWIAGL
jgi:hypothetical protein